MALPTPLPTLVKEKKTFKSHKGAYPGIVAFRNGKWLWSDDLLNLSNNIDVQLEFNAPKIMKGIVNEESLDLIVEDLFKRNGINTYAVPTMGMPDLPSFQLLITAYPVKDGYAFVVNARLFEAVKLARVKLNPGVTMQAITWENSVVQVVPESEFKKDLQAAVEEITKQFCDRYQFFQRPELKKNQNTDQM